MARARRRPRPHAALAALAPDHRRERVAAARGLDLSHRRRAAERSLADPVQPDRRGRHALRDHRRSSRCSRSTPRPDASVGVRSVHRRRGRGERRSASTAASSTGSDRAAARRRILVSAGQYALRARRPHRPADRRLRQGRTPSTCARGSAATWPALYVLSNTPGAVYSDLLILGTSCARRARALGRRATCAPTTCAPDGSAGRSTPSRSRASSATTPGPADAWTRVGGANSWSGDQRRRRPRPGVRADRLGRRSTSGAATGTAPTSSPTACSRSRPAPGGASGTTSSCATTCGIATCRKHPDPGHACRRDGRPVDAVAQVTKTGHVFVFDRETGEPLFPIAEHQCPPSDLEGRAGTWPTQPLPREPAAVRAPGLHREGPTSRRPHRAASSSGCGACAAARTVRSAERAGHDHLPRLRRRREWGGSAFDARTGRLIVNGNEMPWILRMVKLKGRDGEPGAVGTPDLQRLLRHLPRREPPGRSAEDGALAAGAREPPVAPNVSDDHPERARA